MAKALKEVKVARIAINKGTSQGLSNLKMSSMNKSKKRNYKRYKGQGKP
jgi:hypothetical protein